MSNYAISCHGGVGSATGANFLLRTPNLNILVDCGLVQGSEFATRENRSEFNFDPKKMNYLLVTHAHMDHIGRIPKLIKDGFSGVIYSTPETKELSSVMFDDALNLMLRESEEQGLPPMYGKGDVIEALSKWKTISYHENFELDKGINIYLKDAGHILGSAIIEVTLFNKEIDKKPLKIAFTGDLGNSPTPLLRDTEFVTDVDYMIMESVYGDRNHGSKEERDLKLKTIISETLNRGGTVVIPTFSIERTQVILYAINNLIESNQIKKVPVFLDSPLAIKVTEIYKNHKEEFNKKTQGAINSGDDIFDFPGLKIVRDHFESDNIKNTSGPKIIIAASGMSMGGRVLNHEKAFLDDPKSTILLVGYQVPGSIGRQIEEKVSTIKINGTKIKVRANIEKIGGYSSHKDSDNLLDFASRTAPRIKNIFVAMGEHKSSAHLAQRIINETGIEAIVPEKDKVYNL